MYKHLLTGCEAVVYYKEGVTIEFVHRAKWVTMTESYERLFASDLRIFRVKHETTSEKLRDIQANRIALDNCPRHRFDLNKTPLDIGVKLECQRCGGKMSASTVGDYIRGYEASGADPSDIIDNWYGEQVSSKIGWNAVVPVTCPHCKGTGLNQAGEMCQICKGKGSTARCNAMLVTNGNRDL